MYMQKLSAHFSMCNLRMHTWVKAFCAVKQFFACQMIRVLRDLDGYKKTPQFHEFIYVTHQPKRDLIRTPT